MRTFSAALAVAGIAAASATSPPVFPDQWSAIVTTTILENEGGVQTGDQVCCDTSSLGVCQVQYQSQALQQYQDATRNMTKLSTGEGRAGLLSDYNAKKAYTMNGDGSCKSYCPMQDGDFVPLSVGTQDVTDQGSDVGNVHCAGQTPCERWHSRDLLFNVVQMDQMWTWVTEVDGKTVPIGQVENITPFGEPGPNITSAYVQYKDSLSAADLQQFNITGADQCPIGQNCQQNSASVSPMRQAIQMLTGVSAEMPKDDPLYVKSAKMAKSGPPNLPQDWTALQEQEEILGQGYTAPSANELCCTASGLGQCQIKYQHVASKTYFDVTTQQQRQAAPDGSGVIADFKAKKSYNIASNGSCTYYCPIPQQEQGLPTGTLYPIGIDSNATNSGSAVGNPLCGGVTPCTKWAFIQKIFNVIVMEEDDWYLTTDSKGNNIPAAFQQIIEPLGHPEGNMTTIWHDFSVGVANADKIFAVPNAATCPEGNGNQCGQN